MSSTATLGASGIVLGDVDAAGVRWRWNAPSVMGGKPAPREETGDRPYAHGQWDATRYYGPRARDITGSARTTSHEALHAAEQRLRDAVGVEAFDLILDEPGQGRWVQRVRQSGELLWTETTHADGYAHAQFSLGLYAPDPLTYSANGPTTAATVFPSTSGGLTVPFTVPFTIDATVISGRVRLSNPGNLDLPLMLTFTGPVQDAQVANPDTGEVLHLSNPDGQLLDVGQTFTVDTGRHVALLAGQASRRSWVWGDWLMLPPDDETPSGTGTTLALSGTASAGAGLTIAYTPARL